MSPSADLSQSEQYAPVPVELRCGFPGAEVLLVDGQQHLVKREVQLLRVNVMPGVYIARVVIGEAIRDETIVVRPDQPFTRELAPPPIASAIPLNSSATTHKHHQDAARSAVAPQVSLQADGNAAIFVVLREWTVEGQGQRSSGPLAPILILRSADGSDLHTFSIDDADATLRDRVAAQGVSLREGFYRLVSHFGDAVVEMPVYALKDWQTQIYLLSQPCPDRLAPDFGRASVFWARPGTGFDPDREDLRVLESVRAAAESGRPYLTDKGLTDALYEKFDNPMLGLMSAHALLQRKAIDPGLLAHATANLERMLGPISDVIALKLAVNPDAEVAPVEYPPILRWSWELLLQRSVDRPDVIGRHSLAERIGGYVVGRGVWMSWIADPRKESFSSAAQGNARDVAAGAVRQAWRQIERVNLLPARPPNRRGGARGPRVGLEAVASDVPNLKGMVQMLGMPRNVIEDVVGGALLTAPMLTQPAMGAKAMNQEKRRQFNERFVQRLLARRPNDRPELEAQIQEQEKVQRQKRALPEAALEALAVDPSGRTRRDPRDIALETIVNRERPVLFVKDGSFDTNEVTTFGPEAVDLVDRMKQQGSRLLPLLPLIGRIDVVNFPNNIDFVGTGWLVDTDIVVTNRHVAGLIARWDGRKFAFSRGVGGRDLESSLCNAHEFDDLAPDAARIFKVMEVLYIEPDSGPDIAFLQVDRRTDGRAPPFISVSANDAAAELPVCVIGYPARASRRVIPDQGLMKQLYRDRFDVKRAAPGFTSGIEQGSTTHDCTTLGGNSGSVVLDLVTGNAVGLHYAGIYEEDNFAVRASVLNDYIRRKRWTLPPTVETRVPTPSTTSNAPVPSTSVAPGQTTTVPAATTSVSLTIPITVTVSIGTPQTPTAAAPAEPVTAGPTTITGPSADPKAGTPASQPPAVPVSRVEDVLPDYWQQRPEGVLAARVGYFDKDDTVGDVPCIAVSVKPSMLSTFDLGAPTLYEGVPVRYLPADVDEQVQAMPGLESVDSISYDDEARTADRFSFAQISEPMEVTLHVGPEYSWEVLEKFINGSQGRLVSAMYEFHAPHIKDALQSRLEDGGSLTMVLDNATFAKVRNQAESFDRVEVFEDWAERFTFTRIVAPEGLNGLISDSYHIKVTVRDDDTFWLSSGNWKAGSSQPIITQAQRDNAADEDLPGNREWHVVINNKKLATRFRSHILQDLKRSDDLGGDVLPKSMLEETFVDIPIMETLVFEERRPPGRILEPRTIPFSQTRKIKVRPLLTPDQTGSVYSEAVLGLIQSARTSLLFQIPYIGMPSSPRQDRGFIDELIRALTQKLKTLNHARVLLRSGGQRFSAPAHAAWFFKSKGVDIDNRLRVIEDHHTKGMIVDGQRVLLGSHNWSKPGVTLNRDASLLFDDEEVAEYYTEAFEIDWARANRVRPRKFVRTEAVVLEAVGDAPPAGFERVRLSDLIRDDD
ncbi:phospholipase D-like domain-containing protein [Bradyrhizobium liaoningense]|uniref:phospholipase D-like domain-containing protein n=1 Tax=Bradyrhizobium liaoningense TaxID=43992 RepID=UPI0005554636|nr:phospholipase D-like domain-containing protein [Bradyrhizobium liaoningense]